MAYISSLCHLSFPPPAFSISRIYGAFCDAGQNYKNLVGFVKGLSKQKERERERERERPCSNTATFDSLTAGINFDQKSVFGCQKDF